MVPLSEAFDRKAPVTRTMLDDTSWVDVTRGFARSPGVLFEALVSQARWKQNRQIRGGRMVDDPRLVGRLADRKGAVALTLDRAGKLFAARYRARFGGCGLIQYRDGRDGIGLHRDLELKYLEHTISIGLSLGGSRPFWLRPRYGGDVHEIILHSGDAYVMGGRCQADWMHGVPKVQEASAKVSAVWRWTSRRGPPEPQRRA